MHVLVTFLPHLLFTWRCGMEWSAVNYHPVQATIPSQPGQYADLLFIKCPMCSCPLGIQLHTHLSTVGNYSLAAGNSQQLTMGGCMECFTDQHPASLQATWPSHRLVPTHMATASVFSRLAVAWYGCRLTTSSMHMCTPPLA